MTSSQYCCFERYWYACPSFTCSSLTFSKEKMIFHIDNDMTTHAEIPGCSAWHGSVYIMRHCVTTSIIRSLSINIQRIISRKCVSAGQKLCKNRLSAAMTSPEVLCCCNLPHKRPAHRWSYAYVVNHVYDKAQNETWHLLNELIPAESMLILIRAAPVPVG